MIKSPFKFRQNHAVALIEYNLLLVIWVAVYYKTPYDIAYLLILETALAGLCAIVLMLAAKPVSVLWLFNTAGFAFLHAAFMSLSLWFLNTMPVMASMETGELSETVYGPNFFHPLELVAATLRPGMSLLLPFMLIGQAYLFGRHHWKKKGRKGIKPVAVLGHAAQRFGILFCACGLSIMACVLMKNQLYIIVGVLLCRLVWDWYENSSKFNPDNFLGATTFGRTRSW